MFRKIAWQLTSSYIVVILFSMGILGFYIQRALEENFENDLRDSIRQQAHLLATTWSSFLEEERVTEHEKRHLATLARGLMWQNGSRLRVLNSAGRVLVDTGSPDEPELAANPAVQRAMAGEEQTGSIRDPVDGRVTEFFLAYPIRVRRIDLTQPNGIQDQVQGVVYVNRSTTYLRATLVHMRGLFMVGTFISLLFSGTLSLFLSHYMSGPLREIAAAADRLAGGELSIQVPTFSRNEIGELAERFNYMARQLQASTGLLMEEKNKLAVVLSHMADGVVMLDPTGKVALSNPSAEAMLSFPGLDDDGHPLHRLRGAMHKSLREGRDVRSELTLSGGRVARVVYSPVQSTPGEILGCVVILHDITELRRLSELKTEFVSNVSHELKTPLAAVKGLAEILLDGAIREPEGEKFLRSIGREVDRMTRLVMDLLNLSKIESGVVKMEVQPFDLGAFARDVVAGFQTRTREGRGPLSVTVEARGEPPASGDGEVWALGDVDRVEQVLRNLLDNAVRYAPAGSPIEVRVRDRGTICQVDVRDYGPGIAQAELSRIFERFYRVDKARSRDQGGTGLGLSIARQIIERLHGRIWAESDGAGSCFSFTLPVARRLGSGDAAADGESEPTEELHERIPAPPSATRGEPV